MDCKLIFDIGAHNGDDTAYYRHQGFRVVAIEANPELAQMIRERFPDDVTNGSVIVENVAITEREGQTPFFICEHGSIYSSIDFATAASHGKVVKEIIITGTTLPALFNRHGVPYFVKVDIEGADHLCIRSLCNSGDLPSYVSFEVDNDAYDLVRHLVCVGYNGFRLVSQQNWGAVMIPKPGTLLNLAWSARQVARLSLRRIPWLHRIIKATAKGAMHRGFYRRPRLANDEFSKQYTFTRGHSGPLPWEMEHWNNVPEFFNILYCSVTSGLIGSSWYDIQARISRTI